MSFRLRLPIAVAGAAALLHALTASALAVATSTGPAPAPGHGESTPLDLESAPQKASSAGVGGGTLVRTIVGLAIVIAVIYGVAWILKRVKSSKEEKATGNGLEPIATVPLGTGAALHLVRVGFDVVLVGVADHVVTPIRSYTPGEARAKGLLPEPAPAAAASRNGAGPGTTIVKRPAAANGSAAGMSGAQRWMGYFVEELRRRTVRK